MSSSLETLYVVEKQTFTISQRELNLSDSLRHALSVSLYDTPRLSAVNLALVQVLGA